LNQDNEDLYAIYNLPGIYTILDDKEKTLDTLRTSAEYRYIGAPEYDPLFEKFLDDPEFGQIIKDFREKQSAIRAQIRKMEESGAN
jgi:hypothetical protein